MRLFHEQKSERHQVAEPQSHVHQVLRSSHDLNAHWAIERCMEFIRQRFYWPGWRKDCEKYIREATTIADVLVEQVFSKFGCPAELHTDQGTNFESKLFQRLCTRFGVVKTRTTPYRPQSDGQCERFNRTLINAIKKTGLDGDGEWDELVPLVSMHYRATIHASCIGGWLFGETGVQVG